MQAKVLALIDSEGWPRTDSWVAGISNSIPAWWQAQKDDQARPVASSAIAAITAKASAGEVLEEQEVANYFRLVMMTLACLSRGGLASTVSE